MSHTCHCGANVIPGTETCFIHGPHYPQHQPLDAPVNEQFVAVMRAHEELMALLEQTASQYHPAAVGVAAGCLRVAVFAIEHAFQMLTANGKRVWS